MSLIQIQLSKSNKSNQNHKPAIQDIQFQDNQWILSKLMLWKIKVLELFTELTIHNMSSVYFLSYDYYIYIISIKLLLYRCLLTSLFKRKRNAEWRMDGNEFWIRIDWPQANVVSFIGFFNHSLLLIQLIPVCCIQFNFRKLKIDWIKPIINEAAIEWHKIKYYNSKLKTNWS